jgi:hypothetical protein
MKDLRLVLLLFSVIIGSSLSAGKANMNLSGRTCEFEKKCKIAWSDKTFVHFDKSLGNPA